jgi:hypothetical protein
MNGWTIFKILWSTLGFVTLVLILVAVWRARNLIHWNRAIRNEVKALAAEADRAPADRRQAIGIIVRTCTDINNSLTPQHVADADHLRAYIRSIAACFLPQAARPELQISLGHLINSLDASLSRFDRILHRPGLKRIQAISIKTLRGLYTWSHDLATRPWARWYLAHRKAIGRASLLRLVILPDPFFWLLFLSRKLLVLVLMKSLLVDIALFVGNLALDAYGREGDAREADAETLEETLTALSQVDVDTAPVMAYDPAIATVRRELVGISSMLLSSPTIEDWKTAVKKAADIIARRYFPDADRPLEEAALGPLLDRARSLIATLGQGNDRVIVRYAYQTRLETLFQAKDIGDLVLTPAVRGILKTTLATYAWIKWPLKIYRRLKRFSLPGIAADVGWVLGKKSVLILIHGRSFDLACRELDRVYHASAALVDAGTDRPPASHALPAEDDPDAPLPPVGPLDEA